LNPWEIAPAIDWIGDLVGLRGGLDALQQQQQQQREREREREEKKKKSCVL
jgi:hypothetical protein